MIYRTPDDLPYPTIYRTPVQKTVEASSPTHAERLPTPAGKFPGPPLMTLTPKVRAVK